MVTFLLARYKEPYEYKFLRRKIMSDVLNKMKTRRSIRKFKSDMVPQEALDQIIEAGLYAASGMGEQSQCHQFNTKVYGYLGN